METPGREMTEMFSSNEVLHSKCDVGFPTTPGSHPLEYGTVNCLQPVASADAAFDEDDLVRAQPPMAAGTSCARLFGAGCIGASLLGLPFLACFAKIVPNGKVGLCKDVNGDVRLIKSGCHLKETIFTQVTLFDLQNDVISLAPMHILNVRPGMYGLGTIDNNPVVLLPGRHIINDPVFRFAEAVPQSRAHVGIETTHIVTVAQGKYGLCSVNGVGHFLEPGVHRIDNSCFEFHKFTTTNCEYIQICSKHRILIGAGKLGLGFDAGKPIMLEAGQLYNIDNPYFEYKGSVDLTEPEIRHGSLQIITVKDGKLGISFDDGELVILPPGRHFLDKPTHYFQGFLSSGQQTLAIDQVTSMSSDNVGLCFDAAITIQVVDGHKAVKVLSGDEEFSSKRFRTNIIQKAKLALTIIIGNNKVANTFGATVVDRDPMATVVGSANETAPPSRLEADQGDDNSFKQHIHDTFMANFRTSMMGDCGVNVVDMSIEDIKFTNDELAEAMARGAVKATELEMALMNRMIRETEAHTDQHAEVIKAQGQQKANIIRAEGEARALDILAQAQAERILKLDAAIKGVCPTSQSRALMEASGKALKNANSTVVLANDMLHLQRILGHAIDDGK